MVQPRVSVFSPIQGEDYGKPAQFMPDMAFPSRFHLEGV